MDKPKYCTITGVRIDDDINEDWDKTMLYKECEKILREIIESTDFLNQRDYLSFANDKAKLITVLLLNKLMSSDVMKAAVRKGWCRGNN